MSKQLLELNTFYVMTGNVIHINDYYYVYEIEEGPSNITYHFRCLKHDKEKQEYKWWDMTFSMNNDDCDFERCAFEPIDESLALLLTLML